MQNPYLTRESQLLYAKTFHDLAAPLGALTLCLDDIKKALPESAEIVEASVETLSNKIRYWRLMLTGGDESPAYAEAINVIKEMAKLKNVNVMFASGGEYQGVYTRLMLALAMACIESLPRGGDIIINPEEGVVRATAEKCYIPKEFEDAVLQVVDQPSSRHALGMLIMDLARGCGCVLKLSSDPTELLFTLNKA